MGAYDDFFSDAAVAERPAAKPIASKPVSSTDFQIKPERQREMDMGRMETLLSEMPVLQARLKAGDLRAQTDIDALNREIRGTKNQVVESEEPVIVRVSGVAPQQEQGDELDQLFDSAIAARTKKPEQPAPAQAQQPNSNNALQEFGQSAANLADVTVGGVIPAIAGGVTYAGSRAMGKTPEEATALQEQVAGAVDKPFGKAFGVTETPGYKGAPSQQIMDFIGQNINKGAEWISNKTGLPVADVENMINTASFALPAAAGKVKGVTSEMMGAKPAVAPRIEPTMEAGFQAAKAAEAAPQASVKPSEMQSAGAAVTSNKSTLEAAIAQAGPELQKELKSVNPKDLNPEVLNRHLEADTLPVPVRLTKGQALQDPNLISKERNERGFKEQFVERLNEQNKALQENAGIVKERVSPNVNTTDYVADSANIIDAVNEIKKQNAEITSNAYKELENAAGGKFPIDGKKFADDAIAALQKEDRFDYLPAEIKKKLEAYSSGSKEMNFNLFENLRSDLAADMRRADRAGDGTQKHVLGLVRNELENLPLTEDAAGLKEIADKARSAAKADFDLEKSNNLYSKVVGDNVDTKNFIKSFVIDSKNKDFASSLTLLEKDPMALEHVRSGAMDYITRESTDASGNFSNAKFTKLIENLDVNKKLQPLFGAEAETLRKLARTSKLIEARPKGSYVNESNTATALGSMAKQYAGKIIAENLPIVGSVAKTIGEVSAHRKSAQQVKESLKPGAGVKLSDIGKK